MEITASGGTDVGKRRAHNEDCYGVSDELGLYVVADGMGGHAAGEVASKAAVDTLTSFVADTMGRATNEVKWPYDIDPALPTTANRLTVGVRLANRAIHQMAVANAAQRGMGTTLVAALVEGERLYLAHVGDSRAYLVRGGGIYRLTGDHSYVEEQVRAGLLSADQARTHPLKNIVTRALGVKEDVAVELSAHDLKPGDIYLLCSDGLSGMLTDSVIGLILSAHFEDLSGVVAALIDAANSSGGDDNITAVVVRAA